MLDAIVLVVISVVVVIVCNLGDVIYYLFRTKQQKDELLDLQYNLCVIKPKSRGIFRGLINNYHDEKVRDVNRDILRIELKKEDEDGS